MKRDGKRFRVLMLSVKELGSCWRGQSSPINVTGCWISLRENLLLRDFFYYFSSGETSTLCGMNILDSFWFWMEPYRCQNHEPIGTSMVALLFARVLLPMSIVSSRLVVENSSNCCDVLVYMICKVKG